MSQQFVASCVSAFNRGYTARLTHGSAYVGQLFNGFYPIWKVDRNKLQLMVLFPKSLA